MKPVLKITVLLVQHILYIAACLVVSEQKTLGTFSPEMQGQQEDQLCV